MHGSRFEAFNAPEDIPRNTTREFRSELWRDRPTEDGPECVWKYQSGDLVFQIRSVPLPNPNNYYNPREEWFIVEFDDYSWHLAFRHSHEISCTITLLLEDEMYKLRVAHSERVAIYYPIANLRCAIPIAPCVIPNLNNNISRDCKLYSLYKQKYLKMS
jgi:hypothetical protein